MSRELYATLKSICNGVAEPDIRVGPSIGCAIELGRHGRADLNLYGVVVESRNAAGDSLRTCYRCEHDESQDRCLHTCHRTAEIKRFRQAALKWRYRKVTAVLEL